MLGGLLIGSQSAAPVSSLLTGLLGYWALDGNSNDGLGVNNGTDTSVSYVAGKIGQGAQFKGKS